MNDAEITAVAAELAQTLIGRSCTGAWQPARDRVYVGIGDKTLLVVPRGPFARLHLVGARPRNPTRPFSFQGALRAHLTGTLSAVEKDPNDRIVRLLFATHALELRLTGRSGGLWLIGPDGPVAAYDGPAQALPPLSLAPPHAAKARFDGASIGWNAAAERWFESAEARHRLESRRGEATRALGRRIGHLQRLWEGLHEDLARADQAPEVRRRADALAARLHTVPRGTRRIEVPDLEDEAVMWTLELDPALSPAANLDRLYHRARRFDRLGDRVLANLDEVESQLRLVRAALAEVPDADEVRLDALMRLAPPARAARAPGTTTPWDRWIGPHGERVLSGRDAASNNQLTFRVARGSDFWMHVRDQKGAHVVLPMQKGQVPSLDHLLAAAQIALAASKIPEGTAADVQYTRARHVRAVPGAPGLVTLADERVLHVVRDRVPTTWVRED